MPFQNSPPETSAVPEYATILSDANLETFAEPGYSFYLVPPNKSNTDTVEIELRKAPSVDGSAGWTDTNYKIVKRTIDYGAGVFVTEIVPTGTGIWVGIVSENLPTSDSIFYTKIENIRAKSNGVTPAVNSRILTPEEDIEPYVPPGAREISPKDNQTWLTIEPNDVRLVYYNFNEHNQKVIGDLNSEATFSLDNISSSPTLGLSEGYYYFIIGQNRRASKAETSGAQYGENKPKSEVDSAVQEESTTSIAAAKDNAFKNLLDYFGKDKNSSAAQVLKDYFVLADFKVNTTTANPNNQKTLFAIRSEYIDALPDRTEVYHQQFDPDIESSFLTGRDFSINLKVKNIQAITDKLLDQFTKVKSKIDLSKLKVTDANDVDFDIELQMKEIAAIPSIINDFMARQAYPGATNQDSISNLAADGTTTPFDHIIQLGLKDNGDLGYGVRQTVSYVLFSPDPQSLVGVDDQGKETANDLFRFDPYLTDEELQDPSIAKRSAVNLKIGLPYIREKFATTYGSRALHYLLSYTSIYKYFVESGTSESVYDWAEFMQKYSVPPLKIYPSADPQKVSNLEELTCEEIIKRLNQAGPNVGPEEKLLQELLYNSPECQEAYFKQFKKATHAGDANLKRSNLDDISNSIGDRGKGGDPKNSEVLKYLTLIYREFFTVLDPESLISLIIACLQKKLGIDLSIEAICEAAIKELIAKAGVDAVIGLAIANALLAPNKESSRNILIALGKFKPSAMEGIELEGELAGQLQEEVQISLDKRFEDAPLATAMVVSGVDLDAIYNHRGITVKVIEIVRNLEKAGIDVKFIPASRSVSSLGTIFTKVGTEDQYFNQLEDGQAIVIDTPDVYSFNEIVSEKKRLRSLGYSEQESQVLMVQSGFMLPDPNQWLLYTILEKTDALAAIFFQKHSIVLSDIKWGSQANDFKDPVVSSLDEIVSNYNPEKENSADIPEADEFLQYIAETIGLSALCEVILSDLFEGLQDLLKAPQLNNLEFHFGQFGDFVDNLVNKLKTFLMTFSFPDSLSVDTQMDDYFKKLLDTILLMIVKILAQIVRLLIKEALDKCLEENNDQGPAPSPVLGRPASISIPELQLAGIPPVTGIPDGLVAEWLKDLIDRVTNSQLCALLRGDATRATLLDLVTRTQFSWQQIYASGIDTVAEIATIFKNLGENLSLDVCEFITPSSPLVVDVCDAVYNRDARCQELLGAGLTEEECQKQIDRELEDMRNKVVALSGFTVSNGDILNSAIPGVCSDNGFFQLPSGVRYAMETITDNMVETVKGSLLDDLNTLKFFTVPPPVVAAMNDPDKLLELQGMFKSLSKKPFVKECFAYIGNPYDDTQPSNSIRARCYPLTYNRYSHYGGHITRKTNRVGEEYTFPVQYSKDDLARQEIYISNNAKSIYKDIIFHNYEKFTRYDFEEEKMNEFMEESEWFEPMHFAMFLDDEDLRNGLVRGNSKFKNAIKSAYLESIGISPDLIVDIDYIEIYAPAVAGYSEDKIYKTFPNTVMLGTYWDGESSEYDLVGTPILVEKKRASSTKLRNTRAFAIEVGVLTIQPGEEVTLEELVAHGGTVTVYPKNTPIPFIKKQESADTAADTTSYEVVIAHYKEAANAAEISEKISGLYADPTKPKPDYYKDLVVEARDLFRLNRGRGKKGLPGPRRLDIYTATNQNYLRQYYSLDTKLKDINGDANRWYALMSYFVGFDMKNQPGYRAWDGAIKTSGKKEDPPYVLELRPESNDADDAANPDYLYENIQEDLTDSVYPIADKTGLAGGYTDSPEGYYSYYIKRSPGFIRLLELLDEKAGLETVRARVRHAPGKYRTHHFVVAFMELTVREALGLEDERISRLFPKFRSMDGISGIVFREGRGVLDYFYPNPDNGTTEVALSVGGLFPTNLDNVVLEDGQLSTPLGADDVKPTFSSSNRNYQFNQILPMYAVFQQVFVPEEHPLALKPKDMYDYFSGNSDPVNRRLVEILNSETEFDQVIGFNSNIQNFVEQEGPQQDLTLLKSNNIASPKFNPDILKFNMPFKKARVNAVGNSAGIDISILQDMFTDTVKIDQYANLPAEFLNVQNLIQETSKQEDLIYQNIGLPLEKNVNLQLKNPRNVSKIVNGILDQKFNIDPGIITNDRVLAKTKYNFEFAKELEEKVSDLINELYSNAQNVPFGQKVLQDYNAYFESVGGQGRHNPFNYKAQVFGKFLTKKLNDYVNLYKPSNSTGLSSLEKTNLEIALADYAYPSLQKAYVNQVFSRLKDSRLQYKKGMRALWKKILRVKGFNKNTPPECINPLTETTALSNEDLQNTELDFFNIGNVKERILDFYSKSVCRDVYEKSTPEENAARVALLQGTLILMVKVFTLEVCLSGLIAWDSYDISDVVSSESVIKLIINNIMRELPEGITVDFISGMATDIIKKEEGLTDAEFALVRGDQSGIEYLIRKEAAEIEYAIEGDKTLNTGPGARSNVGIFRNRNELSTELNLSILNVSNEAFVDEYKQKINLDLYDEDVEPVFTPLEIIGQDFQELQPIPAMPTDQQLLEMVIEQGDLPEGAVLVEDPGPKPAYPLYPVKEPTELTNWPTSEPPAGYEPDLPTDAIDFFWGIGYDYTIRNYQPSETVPPKSYDDALIFQAYKCAVNENTTIIKKIEDLNSDLQSIESALAEELFPDADLDEIMETYGVDLNVANTSGVLLEIEQAEAIRAKTEEKITFYDNYQNPNSNEYLSFSLQYLKTAGEVNDWNTKKQLYDDQQAIFSPLSASFAEQRTAIEAVNNGSITANEDLLNNFLTAIQEKLKPETFKKFVEQFDLDYSVDARLENNIYTMNYGPGYRQKSIFGVAENGFLQSLEPILEQNLFDQKNQKDVEDVLSKNNRNFFHSLPLRGRFLHGFEAPIDGLSTSGYFDFTKAGLPEQYEDLIKITTLQRDALGMAHAFTKENFVETTFGSQQNAKLGNVLFQPYIRVVDTTPEDREQMSIVVIREKTFDENGEPCDPTFEREVFNASDYEDFFNDIDNIRNFNMNIFYCEIRDYIPLSVWSHFYNQTFIKSILSFDQTVKVGNEDINPILELYKNMVLL